MNATLEAMARALFQSWFVDFDPVRRNKDEGGRLKDEISALFPDSFQESALGLIPKGWKVVNLGSILDVLETGRRPKGGVSGFSFGVPSVGAESINGIGVFDFSKTKFIPRDFYEKTASGRVQNLDVLLYKDGGKPGEFRPRVGLFGYSFPFNEFCINEHVFRMRAATVGQHFLYFAISDERVLLDFANKGGKAAIPGINQADVRSTQILLPEDKILSVFEYITRPICEKIIKNATQSRTLATLRDTLLPKLLSGDLSASNLQ
jgi:type I restriction enzyme S subunit